MYKIYMNLLVLAVVLFFFCRLNDRGQGTRLVPQRVAEPVLVNVDSQKEIYDYYRNAGIWGAKIVHMNRFLNMLDYLPKEENRTMPFPVRVSDARPLYEQGLNPHNWLFIANRTGLVRSAVIVLPDSILSEKRHDFQADFAYSAGNTAISGYSQDMPLVIATLRALPVIVEPVILNVDAGYFMQDEDPAAVAALLRKKCRDIRMVIFSESWDEPEITELSHRKLSAFRDIWGAGLR